MRLFWISLLLCCPVWAHGGSARGAPQGGIPSGGFGGRVPGGTSTPSGKRGGAPTTIVSSGRAHTWRTWWKYNREWYIALRLRGVPVSGTRLAADANGCVTRKKMRDELLTPLMLNALEDKNHHVRSAAAVALGRFGDAT